MTDHEKITLLIAEMGGRNAVASKIGISYGTLRNLVRPGRPLPTWARAMLAVREHQIGATEDNNPHK